MSLEIDFKDLKLIKQISEGGYGIIYIGKWKELTVAVKVLKKEAINDYSIRDFLTECKVMQAIRHPHICNFLWRPREVLRLFASPLRDSASFWSRKSFCTFAKAASKAMGVAKLR